jgi:hypothetical protein
MFFGTPAIVDVGARAHPSGCAAVPSAQRYGVGKVPSIRAVGLSEAVLVHVLRPGADSGLPTLPGAIDIFRGKQLEPFPARELVCGDAKELRAAPVEIFCRPLMRCRPDDMR